MTAAEEHAAQLRPVRYRWLYWQLRVMQLSYPPTSQRATYTFILDVKFRSRDGNISAFSAVFAQADDAGRLYRPVWEEHAANFNFTAGDMDFYHMIKEDENITCELRIRPSAAATTVHLRACSRAGSLQPRMRAAKQKTACITTATTSAAAPYGGTNLTYKTNACVRAGVARRGAGARLCARAASMLAARAPRQAHGRGALRQRRGRVRDAPRQRRAACERGGAAR